jgi:hypothetical protein
MAAPFPHAGRRGRCHGCAGDRSRYPALPCRRHRIWVRDGQRRRNRATELLPCECVTRCPIASLCSAPMELGFGSSLARSFFKLAAAPRSTMSSPLLYAARSRPAPRSMITSERDIVSRAGNATEPSRNSSMISRARGHAGTRAHAQGGVRSECASNAANADGFAANLQMTGPQAARMLGVLFCGV